MNKKSAKKIWKEIYGLLPRKQKIGFFFIFVILIISAVLNCHRLYDGYGSCGAECVLWVGYSHTSGDFIHKCV